MRRADLEDGQIDLRGAIREQDVIELLSFLESEVAADVDELADGEGDESAGAENGVVE